MTDWDNLTTVPRERLMSSLALQEADPYWRSLDPEHRKAVEREMAVIEGMPVWDPILAGIRHPELDRWFEIARATCATGEPALATLVAWFQCGGHQEAMLALNEAFGPQPQPTLVDLLSAVVTILAVPARAWSWSWDDLLIADAEKLWSDAFAKRADVWLDGPSPRVAELAFAGAVAEVWDPVLEAIAGLNPRRKITQDKTLGLWRGIALQAGAPRPEVIAAWLSTPALAEPEGWRQWASYGAATRDAALAAIVAQANGRLSSGARDLVAACGLVARLTVWAMQAGHGLLAIGLLHEGQQMLTRLREVW